MQNSPAARWGCFFVTKTRFVNFVPFFVFFVVGFLVSQGVV